MSGNMENQHQQAQTVYTGPSTNQPVQQAQGYNNGTFQGYNGQAYPPNGARKKPMTTKWVETQHTFKRDQDTERATGTCTCCGIDWREIARCKM